MQQQAALMAASGTPAFLNPAMAAAAGLGGLAASQLTAGQQHVQGLGGTNGLTGSPPAIGVHTPTSVGGVSLAKPISNGDDGLVSIQSANSYSTLPACHGIRKCLSILYVILFQ